MKTKTIWAVLPLLILCLCTACSKASIRTKSKNSGGITTQPHTADDDDNAAQTNCSNPTDSEFLAGRFKLPDCSIRSNFWPVDIPCPGNSNFQMAIDLTQKQPSLEIRTPLEICTPSINLFVFECEPTWSVPSSCVTRQASHYNLYQCDLSPSLVQCINQWQHLDFTLYYQSQ